MLKRSFKLNFILLMLISFNMLSAFAENNQDNIPFSHLEIKIPSQYLVRVLGAGITDKLTHETLQFTCTSVDLNGEQNEHYFLNLFLSCDRLGMLATDITGNKILYPFNILIPKNKNLNQWFKNEKSNLFPNLATAQHKVRKNCRYSLLSSALFIGAGGATAALFTDAYVKDLSLNKRITAGVVSGSLSAAGALYVATLVHLAFDSKTYISTSFSKEDFLNKSKESWQFNPHKTKYYNLIKNELLKNALFSDEIYQ